MTDATQDIHQQHVLVQILLLACNETVQPMSPRGMLQSVMKLNRAVPGQRGHPTGPCPGRSCLCSAAPAAHQHSGCCCSCSPPHCQGKLPTQTQTCCIAETLLLLQAKKSPLHALQMQWLLLQSLLICLQHASWCRIASRTTTALQILARSCWLTQPDANSQHARRASDWPSSA